MKKDFHIIVIGAGSAGLVVASAGASLGASVALIEGHKMGGDCLNYGCIPSKAFLKPAHLLSDIQKSNEIGLTKTNITPNFEEVMNRVNSVIEEIEPHDSKERFESLGVTVIEGVGSLIDNHTVKVGKRNITGHHIVLATGSRALIPDIPGLKEASYLDNESFFELKETPKHLIVLGAGPIGLELGQGCRHLGSKVTIIDRSETLFTKDDPEVGPLMHENLSSEGIHFKLGAHIDSVKHNKKNSVSVEVTINGKQEKISGSHLLVSLGRTPVTDTLNCDSVGVKRDEKGYIETNEKLQTNISSIYACGDVVGPYQFTHMASYQAGIIIRNIIFKMGAKVDYSTVPWTTYTKPEVAHVGYTEPWAKAAGKYKEHVIINLNSNDRSKTENDRTGFLKLILGPGKRLIGATLVGDKAGEIIPVATLAIQQKLKASIFLNMIFAYPSQAEIFKFASLELSKRGFKPWMKKLIKVLFLRRTNY